MDEYSRDIEVKAAEERQRLHASVAELRSCLGDTISIKKNTRRHLGIACGMAAIIGLTTGYSLAGIFTGHERRVKWQS